MSLLTHCGIVSLWQCDEVQSFENMAVGFVTNNPHYVSGFTITADIFQNIKGKSENGQMYGSCTWT